MDVRDKNVVVTGVIAGHSRATAETVLRAAGAHVQPRVTRDTDLLITGERVGATKITAAGKNGCLVVPWEQVWNGNGASASSTDEDEGAAEAAPLPHDQVREIGAMLATKGDLPVGDQWQYEVKWDGYRCIATIRGGKVHMQSRSGRTDYTKKYPKVTAELAKLPDCIIDGELVVIDKASGEATFQNIHSGNGAGTFIAFDCLEAQGHDVAHLALEDRRVYLDELITRLPRKHVTVSPAFPDGDALMTEVKQRGLEGIVAKRIRSTYQEGRRSPDWIKTKIRNEQEFIVAGYKPGEGNRAGTVGALVLAVNDTPPGDGMVFCGKVGTGFTARECDRLRDLLVPVAGEPDMRMTTDQRKACKADRIVWVEPTVVVQVEFQRWTPDGVLWHPAYTGQRDDKDAREVVRES